MKNLIIIGIVVLLILVGGAAVVANRMGLLSQTGRDTQPMETIPHNEGHVIGHFEGNMPCADCTGIKMTITLRGENAEASNGTYTSTSVYEGKSEQPVATEGKWEVVARNSTERVLKFTDNGSTDSQYYILLAGNQEMMPSDAEGNPIDSPFNMTLKATTGGEQTQPSGNTNNSNGSKLANPASENCAAKGGTTSIQTRGDGGQYGLCMFEDNYACEEWAMMRGDCPVGGVRTTGFDNTAQMYCAWLGGKTLAEENATCTLPGGKVCDDNALYNGTCSAN